MRSRLPIIVHRADPTKTPLCFGARDAIKATVKAIVSTCFVLLLALVLAACAGAPSQPPESPPPAVAPEPPAAPAPPPAPPAIPISNQICGVQAGRTIDLADLSLPEGSRPLGLALAADTVWLLFEPALLVGLPREVTALAPVAIPEFGAIEEMADMIPGPPGVAWSALAVDRFDGSVWLVSETVPGLWRKRPGRRPEAIRLPATPALRRGGFRDVMTGRGSVWIAPACADSAVWRLSPSGKLLGTDFDAPVGGCQVAALARDWSGTVWALQPEAGEVFQLGFDQKWQPAPGAAPPAPVPPGSKPVDSWFFWGAEAFGSSRDGAGGAPLLYRNAGGRIEAFQEDCGEGNSLVDVAGDERGWAVLTRRWLRLADHQREDGASAQE